MGAEGSKSVFQSLRSSTITNNTSGRSLPFTSLDGDPTNAENAHPTANHERMDGRDRNQLNAFGVV